MIAYTCSYDFSGKRHAIHVMANDEMEVSQRLRAIGMTAKVDGKLIYEGEIYPLNWLERLKRRSVWK